MFQSSSSSPFSLPSSGDISMPARLLNMASGSKPDIQIHFEGQGSSAVPTFSTLDRIEGTVTIKTQRDTLFADVEIDFIGMAKTYVEKMPTTTAGQGRMEAMHQFLKLSQPIASSAYPESGVLKADQAYTFDFLFIVPGRMLDRVCRHKVDNEAVRDAHLQLPPTFGKQELIGKKESTDDMAPEMAHIRYAIVASVGGLDDSYKRQDLATLARAIRIVPAKEEHPPLTVDGPNSEYTMRSEKSLKKGVFKGKLGTLVMEAAQPRSLRLPRPDATSDTPVTTMATVMLRFDPAEADSPPPRLGSLSSKLKVVTFYASSARTTFPNRKASTWDWQQGVHGESSTLPTRCVAGVEWTHHSAAESLELSRRDSAVSSSSSVSRSLPQPSTKYQGHGFYSAEVLVPVTLPTNKSFPPTFHSCLVSRVYSLTLQLSVHSVSLTPSIELKVPVQISAEGCTDQYIEGQPSLTAEELASEAQQADDFFESRVLSPVAEHLVGRSSLAGISEESEDLPPGYEMHPRQLTGVVAAGRVLAAA